MRGMYQFDSSGCSRIRGDARGSNGDIRRELAAEIVGAIGRLAAQGPQRGGGQRNPPGPQGGHGAKRGQPVSRPVTTHGPLTRALLIPVFTVSRTDALPSREGPNFGADSNPMGR